MLNEIEMKKMHKIIGSIYSSKDINIVRKRFMDELIECVPYDCAIFDRGKMRNSKIPYTIDPLVHSNFPKEKEIDFLYKYEKVYSAVDYVKWVFTCSDSLTYRTTDLLQDSVRRKSSFYLNYLQKFDLDYAAGIVLVHNNNFLGTLTLFKKHESGNFSDKDMYLLEQFLPHLESKFIMHELSSESIVADESFLLKHQFPLTHREIEIMGCIYRGLKNDDIADYLKIAPNTVKKHITNIYSKLYIESRTDLVKFIMNNELDNIWEDYYE